VQSDSALASEDRDRGRVAWDEVATRLVGGQPVRKGGSVFFPQINWTHFISASADWVMEFADIYSASANGIPFEAVSFMTTRRMSKLPQWTEKTHHSKNNLSFRYS